jgi:hypothetical protein
LEKSAPKENQEHMNIHPNRIKGTEPWDILYFTKIFQLTLHSWFKAVPIIVEFANVLQLKHVQKQSTILLIIVFIQLLQW